MKKLTAIILALLLSFSITACKTEVEHTHVYETSYSFDDTHHFYKATCEHVEAVSGKAEHDYDSNFKCKTCNYQHEHKYDTKYTGDNEYHWYPSICGHTEFVKDKQPHELNIELYCIHCDRKHKHTYNDYYSSDETYHWKDTTCGHPLAITIPEEHDYNEEGQCKICPYACKHEFSSTYTYNSTHHWFSATCDHKTLVSGEEEHTYDSDFKCKCGYKHIHTFESTYTYDSEKHYKKSTCGHNVVDSQGSHEYDNTGHCVCGAYDESKNETLLTNLYVVSYDGGWGIDWLNQMARSFEELYKNYSFEQGKKGIKIHVKGGRNDVTNANVKTLMDTSEYDLYFTTFNLREFATQGKLMDITDVVTNTTSNAYKKVWLDLGETKTIADKMDSSIKEYVLYAGANSQGVVDAQNPKYYGIPMYSSFYNLNYDIDLFYEKGFYLKEDGTFCSATKGYGSKTEAEVDAQKSLGQDGIKGTLDDGLPITFQDFYNVCHKMQINNISPMCWAGSLSGYRTGFFNSLWANYEGVNDWYINVTGEGNDSEFGEITLANQNGYLTSGQKGRLSALTFAEYVINEQWWDTDASSATTNYDSQDKFLYSKYYSERSSSVKRIAMIIEGSWWENEAKATLNYMAELHGEEYVNRRFGIMPYPRMDDGHYTQTKYIDQNGNYTLSSPAKAGDPSRKVNDMAIVSVTPHSNVAIRANALQPEAAKLFLAYTTANENLRKYTRLTGSTRPYNYELTNGDLSEMSTYKRQVVSYYTNAVKTGNMRYTVGANKFSENNSNIIQGDYSVCRYGLRVGSLTCNASDPISLFQHYSVSATNYFNAYKSYYSDNNGANWKLHFINN